MFLKASWIFAANKCEIFTQTSIHPQSAAPSISQRIATIAGGVSDNSQHIFNFDCLTNSFPKCYLSNEHAGENLNLHMIILWGEAEPESAGEIVGNE